jgi:hypothetical protein
VEGNKIGMNYWCDWEGSTDGRHSPSSPELELDVSLKINILSDGPTTCKRFSVQPTQTGVGTIVDVPFATEIVAYQRVREARC